MQSKKTPNRADVKLAVLKLLLLAGRDESEFTEVDFAFLKSDLAGKLLQYWPDWFSMTGMTERKTRG
jgi:hypothetical protein